jgi:aldose 1-epimerase
VVSAIELHVGEAYVTVDPAAGGRVAQIEVAGRELLLDDLGYGPLSWGSFPMVPWAGRVRDARFEFDGVEHVLSPTMAPHAIHGTGCFRPWTIDDQGFDYVDMRCALDWPFGGTAVQHLQLVDDRLICFLTAVAGDRAMPAVVGWHPWFRKPARLDVSFDRMYRRDATHVATAELVEPTPPPWDDCFVGSAHPPRLVDGDITVTVDSDCDHWVVFDVLHDTTCVEPQSGPPDAFSIGGATRLEPGEMLQRWMSIGWA